MSKPQPRPRYRKREDLPHPDKGSDHSHNRRDVNLNTKLRTSLKIEFQTRAQTLNLNYKEAFAQAVESWIRAIDLRPIPVAKRSRLYEQDPLQRFQVRMETGLAERFENAQEMRSYSEMGAVTQAIKRWLINNPEPVTE